MKHASFFVIFTGLFLLAHPVGAQFRLDDLATLAPGRTGMQNALWVENEAGQRFDSSKRVVVAEITGPATITMIHFALPLRRQLNRDLLLKIYWDGEKEPSVDCPLVDFFCDPAGMREEVNSALVNKRRGWNAYFPMPFRKSARVELIYDGPLPASGKLWQTMPCYSYVMYRPQKEIPESMGYFHAHWSQESLILGRHEYTVLDAKGKGKFIGWNVTVRAPGRTITPEGDAYPVDQNEKFFVDGEAEPSIEFQGMEDSFGFSWGFRESQSQFPLTGYCPFFKGAFAYRFFMQDSIGFDKSLCVKIGFGKREDPGRFAKPENRLQMSSTVYWYQTEPHAALPALPPAAARTPAPEDPSWAEKEDRKESTK